MLLKLCVLILVLLGRMMRTYSELIGFDSFIDRYRYLKLNGKVAEPTFGWKRFLNQNFYKSREWQDIRNIVIARDFGCDLGVPGYEIEKPGVIYIHHMNPITDYDIKHHTKMLVDPEYLICVSFGTHQAIHYGDESLVDFSLVERTPMDTCPWK